MKKGDKYNFLKAVEFIKKDNCYRKYWKFKCKCGKEKIIRVDSVLKGKVKSCGCYNKERHTKHGKYNSPIYRVWRSMKDRCLNKNHLAYGEYGGRGINICEKWIKFEGFYEDMGDRPTNKSLDRIDNDKGYYKENCKWSTQKEQSNNKRNNHLITFKGKTQNVTQWSEELGINRETLYGRINRRKLTPEQAFQY